MASHDHELKCESCKEEASIGAILLRLYELGYLPMADFIAKQHNVTLRVLLGKTRFDQARHARKALYQALRDKGMTLVAIATTLNRDHSSISVGLRTT